MPTLRRTRAPAGPALEQIVSWRFTDPVPEPAADDLSALRERAEALYGSLTDRSWLTGGALVSYHHMARTVVKDLGGQLAGIDLVITVDASPDCRHQSYPGPILVDLLPGDPIMLGVSEQGVAGPFTALRIAHRYLRSGAARRALILIMEQSTLPPDDTAILPTGDVAVALILGPDGALGLGTPAIAVTRTAPAEPWDGDADLHVVGATVTGIPDGPTVRRAEPGHPCAGVWLALADLLDGLPADLAAGLAAGAGVLVADSDPVLPYRCAVHLTPHPAARRVPVGRPATRGHRVPEVVR